MAGTLIPTSQTTTSLLADSNLLIASHVADLANPHVVTATQVGLGSVDNTSDANKPISTATQTALDLKVSKTSATGSAVLPSGTTAQRDGTPAAGYTRFNSDYAKPEVYNGTGWSGLGGADGNGGDAVFYVNDNTIDNAYTLASGKNAHSVGPITINAAVTLNGRWVIS